MTNQHDNTKNKILIAMMILPLIAIGLTVPIQFQLYRFLLHMMAILLKMGLTIVLMFQIKIKQILMVMVQVMHVMMLMI